MRCLNARELADPFLSDQLPAETTGEVVRHLETCPACREEFAARSALRSRLQSALSRATDLAPHPEFVEALSARLRPGTGRAMSRRAWLLSWQAIAASAVGIVGGGLLARGAVRRSRLAALARNAAGDHQNCALTFNLAERPIALEEAAARYDAAYASLVTLDPPGGLPDGPVGVLDRHSCVYEGRRFGHVILRYRNRPVSLLVTALTESLSGAPEILPTDGAMSVAAFSSGHHAIFVVSDLGERDTSLLAQALVDPLTRRLRA